MTLTEELILEDDIDQMIPTVESLHYPVKNSYTLGKIGLFKNFHLP